MDLSKEYILMCEKAVEIQRLRWIDNETGIEILQGDFLYSSNEKGDESCIFVCPTEQRQTIHPFTGKQIWLPRQDQLQEIINPNNNLDAFNDFAWKWRDDSGGQLDIREHTTFNTLEQAWLAFVMEAKHNKTWNGKDWI